MLVYHEGCYSTAVHYGITYNGKCSVVLRFKQNMTSEKVVNLRDLLQQRKHPYLHSVLKTRTLTFLRSESGAITSGEVMTGLPKYLSSVTLPLTAFMSPTRNSASFRIANLFFPFCATNADSSFIMFSSYTYFLSLPRTPLSVLTNRSPRWNAPTYESKAGHFFFTQQNAEQPGSSHSAAAHIVISMVGLVADGIPRQNWTFRYHLDDFDSIGLILIAFG